MSKLIVGLGNPGPRYARTRHNIGFCIAEKELLPALHLKLKKSLWGYLSGKGEVDGQMVHVLLPQRYMNRSGDIVSRYQKKHRIPLCETLVIYDDIDLPLGKLRFKDSGSSGGHQGLQSILDSLGTDEFARLKVGIGRPPATQNTADYVLEDFTRGEEEGLPPILELARKAVLAWCRGGSKEARDLLSVS